MATAVDCAQYLQACMDKAPDAAALFTKTVGEQGNPSFVTVVKVMHALGLQFKVGARPRQS